MTRPRQPGRGGKRAGAGRPRTALEARSERVQIRLTPHEASAVDAVVAASGAVDRATWGREVLLAAVGYDPVVVPPDEDGGA